MKLPKTIYCSKCGISLTQSRTVINREIVDCVEPHNCPGYAIEVSDKPTIMDLIKATKPVTIVQKVDINPKADLRPSVINPSFEDKRDGIKTTSAPTGILNALKQNETSNKSTEDLDDF